MRRIKFSLIKIEKSGLVPEYVKITN